MIPYGRQDISPEDIDAVTEVLRSDWLTQGRAGRNLKAPWPSYCDARNAVAVCNATAALHIACLALDLGPGDYLWTTPNTFVASANCALYCGANVDFVDIDPRTYNMSVAALTEKLEIAQAQGRLPKICAGTFRRPILRNGGDPDARRSLWLSDHRGCIARRGRRIPRSQGRRLRLWGHRDFQLSSRQDHHDRRRRDALTNDDRLYRRISFLRTHGIIRDPAEMTAGRTRVTAPGPMSRSNSVTIIA